MSKELDKKRCGANVEKVIIDEFVPSEALECLESEKRIMWAYDYDIIKQALLKSQEQKEMIVELCEYFGLDDLYPYDDLEKIESALKNARDVSTQQRMEFLGKLNKQEKENAELKRVLEIIKEKNVNVYRFESEIIINSNFTYRYYINNYGAYHNGIKIELLDEEEFDILKRYFGNE